MKFQRNFKSCNTKTPKLGIFPTDSKDKVCCPEKVTRDEEEEEKSRERQGEIYYREN